MRVVGLASITAASSPVVGCSMLDEPGHEAVDLGTDTDAERVDYLDKARRST